MAKTGRNPLTNTLEDAVQHREIEKRNMWPTPMKGDAHLSSTEEVAKKRIKEGKITLSRAVQSKMWPTPTSTDGQRGDVKNLDGYRRRKEKWKKKGVNIQKPLDVAVALDEEKKMWPTPLARDVKDLAVKPTWKKSLQSNLPREVMKEEKKTWKKRKIE
jgi:hypothetical protein